MKAKPVLNLPDQEYDYGLPPREGEMVEFLIAGRYVSLLGWYGLLMFHSRCAQYAPERVERWRPQRGRSDSAELELVQTSALPTMTSSESLNAILEN